MDYTPHGERDPFLRTEIEKLSRRVRQLEHRTTTRSPLWLYFVFWLVLSLIYWPILGEGFFGLTKVMILNARLAENGLVSWAETLEKGEHKP